MKNTPAQKILNRPIAEWPQAINSTKASLQDVESELGQLVQRAALLHAYIAHRYNTGCGDQGHEASAKVANRSQVKIRKALGYSYPERTSIRI